MPVPLQPYNLKQTTTKISSFINKHIQKLYGNNTIMKSTFQPLLFYLGSKWFYLVLCWNDSISRNVSFELILVKWKISKAITNSTQQKPCFSNKWQALKTVILHIFTNLEYHPRLNLLYTLPRNNLNHLCTLIKDIAIDVRG